MDPIAAAHVATTTRYMGITARVLGLGLWIDGVVNKWDRSSSLEMVTMSFPGLVGRWTSIRIPLFSMEHDWVMKAHTFDDVLTIITWSLQQCCVGKMPECRHDGAPWCAADAKRKRLGGTDLGCAALLCQVTRDWKMFKDVFRFPQHNEVAGCCFKCSVTPAGIRDTTSAAPWRSERLGHWDLVARMRSQGITPTPLFNAPGVRSSIFRLDWLHVADVGVSADWLGGLFTFLAEHKFPGRSFAAKLSGLWQRIQQLYRVHPPAARLDQLTYKMLNRGSPSPKLRCHGMEVRCLIPVAKDLSQEYLREGDLVEQAIGQGTLELSACYDCLSRSAPGGELATRSRKFAALLVSLEVHLPGVFRVKSKLHFFQDVRARLARLPVISLDIPRGRVRR